MRGLVPFVQFKKREKLSKRQKLLSSFTVHITLAGIWKDFTCHPLLWCIVKFKKMKLFFLGMQLKLLVNFVLRQSIISKYQISFSGIKQAQWWHVYYILLFRKFIESFYWKLGLIITCRGHFSFFFFFFWLAWKRCRRHSYNKGQIFAIVTHNLRVLTLTKYMSSDSKLFF